MPEARKERLGVSLRAERGEKFLKIEKMQFQRKRSFEVADPPSRLCKLSLRMIVVRRRKRTVLEAKRLERSEGEKRILLLLSPRPPQKASDSSGELVEPTASPPLAGVECLIAS